MAYCDGVDDRQLIIYIQLLPGVKPNDMHIQVSEERNQLKCSICWSDVILQPSKLLSKDVGQNSHPKYDPSHTDVASFSAATKKLHGSGSNQDV